MSASYFPVTGDVVSNAACQRIRVRPVVFEFGKRLSSLRGTYLAIRIRLFGVGFLHADETRFFESTAITRINNLKNALCVYINLIKILFEKNTLNII